MAITYANVFALLGEWVERVNEFKAWYTTIDTGETETIGDYVTQSEYELMSRIPSTFTQVRQSVLSIINQMNQRAAEVLTDRDLVKGQLAIGDASDVQTILAAMVKDMQDNSQTIKSSVVTVSSVTDATAGADAGTLILSKVLDGYNSPSKAVSMQANRYYNGLDSELSNDDSMVIKCITDSEQSSVNEGAETWKMYGRPASIPFDWNTEGSGGSMSLTTLNSGTTSFITNAEFETWSGNTPGSWTIDNGTAGTHIFAASGADAYRGSYALKITGDGSQATIGISQAISTNVQLNPRRRYLVACFVKGTAATLAGTLTIQFEGTGYTAGASEKISMDHTALSAQTSYGIEYFWINMPDEIPDDMELVIKVTSTLTNAKSVYVDGLVIGPAIYENGVAMGIVAGADKFLIGDQFSFTVSNDDAGVFQTWFRKAFGVQLPSDGSPTIADSLAT